MERHVESLDLQRFVNEIKRELAYVHNLQAHRNQLIIKEFDGTDRNGERVEITPPFPKHKFSNWAVITIMQRVMNWDLSVNIRADASCPVIIIRQNGVEEIDEL